MKGRSIPSRFSVILALVVLLVCAQGCTYLRYRVEDAAELLDVGLTVTTTPQFAIYGDGVSLLPGGYADIDGYFVGWGGGQIGITRHCAFCWGVLAGGYEELGWGEFVKGDPKTLSQQYVGIVGAPFFPFLDARPDYMPSCVHYVHLGWLGLVANARYMEMIDFLFGWATLDIGGDDGKKLGKWPWQWRL